MTKTETVGTERLEEIAAEYGDMAGTLDGALKDGPGAASTFYMSCSLGEIASMATELLASRTRSPAEWEEGSLTAVEKLALSMTDEKIADELDNECETILGLIIHNREGEIASHIGAIKSASGMLRGRASRMPKRRAASIPAPERSKEETVGVLSVPDAMAQLAAAIEAEKRRNAVRDEMLATVIVNLEKSELTAEFAVLLRDYVRAERAKLSALETPEAATSGSAAEYDRDQLAKLAFAIYYSANLCAPQNIAAVIEEIDTCGNDCEHVSGSTCYREQAGKFCPFSVAEDLRQLSAALYGPKPPNGYVESVFGPDRMSALRAAPVPVPVTSEADGGFWRAPRKFHLGDRVTKTKGSSWTGKVVGFYSTALTPVGYAVESENEPGSVQIYPEAALSVKLGEQG